MAAVNSIDLILNEGAFFIVEPLLFGTTILRLTRNGIGYNRVADVFSTEREYVFKTSGLFAYKPRFQSAGGPGGDKVHVIYSI